VNLNNISLRVIGGAWNQYYHIFIRTLEEKKKKKKRDHVDLRFGVRGYENHYSFFGVRREGGRGKSQVKVEKEIHFLSILLDKGYVPFQTKAKLGGGEGEGMRLWHKTGERLAFLNVKFLGLNGGGEGKKREGRDGAMTMLKYPHDNRSKLKRY